ncbi:XRE family transcriptional regulator (plasmid) [Bacillus albus]|uniref:helix-turn-helix domain-containing protein n=1 Tax=Bacillus cereus group TaxID=86661 RepID=UPI0022E87E55|nr:MULTISPECIES: XRE family transcriptional regulator [Bacillus cereus group]MDA2030051.1 XRE family transcriptional regulator [Bacillus cereus group sp. Bcc03]MDA2219134.1 XRE family transcriptional regulator [Bacillus cereus group sp. Bc228]MDA2230753.1 XRE family transcriptional regulator [Bacillus cereus group sp. Bc227]MDA2263402.1 XRE family transcriptional regulator [Bacillus cereus group sp. Bc200]MDA2325670.1 XRE family transcriptional regulator [Bacillus cereus group sp. Bc177]
MDNLLQMFRDALLISEPIYKTNELVWNKWNAYFQDVENNNNKVLTSPHASPSFTALVSWLEKKQESGTTLVQIYAKIDSYKEEIYKEIEGFIDKEFQNVASSSSIIVENDQNIEETSIVNHEDYYEVNNSAVYYKLRDGIAKNQFEEDELSKVLQYPIETKSSNGVAQLSSHKDEDLRLTNIEEAARWNTLVDDVMSNMDDLTADCLDAITIQWINEAKSPDEFIDFSYEQVLEMCNIPKTVVKNKEYYRAEDKIKIAKRIAALASIFIYLNDDNEVVVLNDREDEGERLELKREVVKRLFVLDSVVLWRHSVTNEYMGIESCRIKPGSFLTNYLYGSNNTTALLSKKALEYNSYRHKYHKRLIRYLTWQWRIRQMYSSLKKPYSIGGDKGLLAVMDIPKDWKPNRIREQLENVLMDLENEKVISHWEYSDPLDEQQIGKRNWFKNYYTNLGITILPPEEMLQSMDRVIGKKIIEEPQEQLPEVTVVKEIKKTVESVEQIEKKIRDQILKVHNEKKVSIREIADEISISPSTLSRFCNYKTKRLSKKALEKLTKWCERQEILEKM